MRTITVSLQSRLALPVAPGYGCLTTPDVVGVPADEIPTHNSTETPGVTVKSCRLWIPEDSHPLGQSRAVILPTAAEFKHFPLSPPTRRVVNSAPHRRPVNGIYSNGQHHPTEGIAIIDKSDLSMIGSPSVGSPSRLIGVHCPWLRRDPSLAPIGDPLCAR